MITVNHQQGSPEWLAYRRTTFNASEAAGAMGESRKIKRNELLALVSTGTDKEVSDWVQRNLFDKGHAAEAKARTIIEDMIGEELYPVVGYIEVDGMRIGASFDGITADADTGFEHKLWNESLAAQVRDCSVADNPDYFWQLEQQCLVGGLSRVLFVCSDGTEDRFESMTYEPRPGRAEKLIAAWRQFRDDVAAYKPRVDAPAVVASPVETLPAINYRLDGTSLTSNIADYREAAMMLVERSKAPLVTDQDFADREALCKAFGEAEKRIEVMCKQVLGEIEDVAEFDRQLRDIGAMFRAARLAGEKLVESEKKARRLAIQQGAEKALADHIASASRRLAGRVKLPVIAADFVGAMKGKRTIASLQDAVDTLLAKTKIEVNAFVDGIHENLTEFDKIADGFQLLFADLDAIVRKPAEDFAAVVKSRIAEHQEKEKARLEAERERIRREEAERIAREQAAEAARIAREKAAEAARIAREQAAEAERLAREKIAEASQSAREKQAEATRLERENAADFARLASEQDAKNEATCAVVDHPKDRITGPNGWDMVQVLSNHYSTCTNSVFEVLERDRALIKSNLYPF